MTTVAELAHSLSGDVVGNAELVLLGVQSLEKAGPHDITFVADERNLRRLFRCRAGAVIVPRSLADSIAPSARPAALLLVDDAREAFMQVLLRFRPRRAARPIGISPQAVVSDSAVIGLNVNIHPGAYVGDDVTIGDNCDIHPGACVGPGCRLGNQVTLHANAVLYPEVILGDRVIVHSGAVIGADGFGYQLENGRHVRIPHCGTVRVGNDVEIGACTTVDRAMIGETVVGDGTKLDNLVMVAHNCELGRHNILVSQVGLAGSVTTGDYVVLAGQVGVADHVRLGDGCRVGAKAGVHKDLPGNQTYIGAPAAPEADARRILMAQQKLPELRKQLRDLERQMAELSARINNLETRGRGDLRAAA